MRTGNDSRIFFVLFSWNRITDIPTFCVTVLRIHSIRADSGGGGARRVNNAIRLIQAYLVRKY